MDLQDGRGDLSRDTPDVFLPCVSRLPPVSFYPTRYWPTVAVASSRGGALE